jgi:hypothetical protein
MARPLDEIVRLDRRWFWAHPQRQHRCRWPDACELDLCDSDRGARLVIAIRHLGRGHVVYQPVIYQDAPPADEKAAAALFALAATSAEPIPVIAQMDILRLRHGLRQEAQSHAASARVPMDRKRGRRIKRALDLMIAGLGMLLAAPLMLLIAFMIKLESPGSVLFVQEHLGQGRVPFPVSSSALCVKMPSATRAQSGLRPTTHVSRVWGRFLRKTKMDELPQLINVLVVKCPWSIPVRSASTLCGSVGRERSLL